MKAKYARAIRVGIMSKCLPYITGESGDGYYTVLDFATKREFTNEFLWGIPRRHLKLAQRARNRTETWTIEREVE